MGVTLETRTEAGGHEPVVASGLVEPSAAPRRFRPDIQGLRAVAVGAVVLYHCSVPGFAGGYVGVDVFFAISGFLITLHLAREGEKKGHVFLREFYARRVRRLLPLAVVVVLTTLVVARLVAPPLTLKPLGIDSIWTAFYSLNFHLSREGVNYQEMVTAPSPLQHFWSLAVEEQFYLGWPLMVGLIAFFAPPKLRRAALLTAITGIFIVSLAYCIRLTAKSPSAYFSVIARAWELALGGILALVITRFDGMPKRVAALVSWIGLGLIAFAVFTYDAGTPFPGYAALVPVGGAVLVILAGVRHAPGSAELVLRPLPMQSVGKVSYAWYLWHWPFLILFPMVVGATLNWGENLLVVAFALVLSYATFVLVESPSLRSRRPRRTWLLAGLAMSGAMVVGGLLLIASVPSLIGSGPAQTLVSRAGPADRVYVQQVDEAINAAASVTVVPSNLQPALKEAVTQFPASESDGCNANFLDAVPPANCFYGDLQSPHTVVVFGDSHAQQWLPAYTTAAQDARWRVASWTKNACPAARVTIHNPQLGRTYTECDEWRDRVLANIVAMQPDLVVIGQSDFVVGADYDDQKWADATVDLLREIRGAGIPVVYMLDTPYPKGDAPACLSQHMESTNECAVDASAPDLTGARHAVMAKTISAAGFDEVEPRNWFCGAQECPTIVGNLLVYRDASHLTVSYSNWLAPLLEPLLVTRPAGG